MNNRIEISLVIPLFNERENVMILNHEIEASLMSTKYNYEVIWVDDGSLDGTQEELRKLDFPNRVILGKKRRGQSSALMEGIDAAYGEIVVTLDGDLQNDPVDIPSMLALLDQGYDVICGARLNRHDDFLRKALSIIANRIARKVTGVPVSDLGCTLRVFRKNVMRDVRLMGEMHRTFVVYLHLNGASIKEMKVNHRERRYGKSKYGYERIIKFTLDLLLVIFYSKFREKPLYYFGNYALLSFGLGFSLQIAAIVLRILEIKMYLDGTLILTGVILQCFSFLFLSIGLLGELILRLRSLERLP